MLADLGDGGIALGAVTGTDLHLQQFMMSQGLLEFRQDRIGQTMLTDRDDGLQMMGLLLQPAFLFGRDRHDVVIRWWTRKVGWAPPRIPPRIKGVNHRVVYQHQMHD